MFVRFVLSIIHAHPPHPQDFTQAFLPFFFFFFFFFFFVVPVPHHQYSLAPYHQSSTCSDFTINPPLHHTVPFVHQIPRAGGNYPASGTTHYGAIGQVINGSEGHTVSYGGMGA